MLEKGYLKKWRGPTDSLKGLKKARNSTLKALERPLIHEMWPSGLQGL